MIACESYFFALHFLTTAVCTVALVSAPRSYEELAIQSRL